MTSDKTSLPPLRGEAAKSSLNEDDFGLRRMAEVIAEAVSSRVSANGYAIGIEGEWGSGKSSLLNFIVEILNDEPSKHHKIVRFEPWLVGNKEALLRVLFKKLSDKIKELKADSFTSERLKLDVENVINRLIPRLDKYAARLDLAVSITAFIATIKAFLLFPLFGPVLAFLAPILKRLPKFSDLAKKLNKPPISLEMLKEQIVDDLRALNDLLPGSCITVLIDDTDRLESSESIEILRLIKAVANFPLVTYLVCFDRKILSAQVQTALNVRDGEDYIEKIFQQIISVPPQEPFALRRFVKTQLTEIFPDAMSASELNNLEDSEFDERRDTLFDKWLGSLVKTPRDAIRLCEAVSFGWPYLHTKGDFADYVWLQLIKLKCPALYEWVQDYVTNLGSLRDGGRPGDGEYITSANRLRVIIGELNWSDSIYSYGLTYFLPGLRKFQPENGKGTVFDVEEEELAKFEIGNRLGSPSHWRYYFAFDKPSYAIDDADLKTFRQIVARDWKKAVPILRDLARAIEPLPGQKLDVFLDRLVDQRSSLSPDEQLGMAYAFAEVMDEVPISMGVNDPWRKAVRLMGKSVSAQFSLIVQNGVSINWLALVMRNQGFALNESGQNREIPERQWLARADFQAAKDILLERAKTLGMNGILKLPQPVFVLLFWKEYGNKDELREAVDAMTKSDEGFLKFVDGTRTWISSSSKGLYQAVDSGILENFMSTEAAKARLDELALNKDGKEDRGLLLKVQELISAWSRG